MAEFVADRTEDEDEEPAPRAVKPIVDIVHPQGPSATWRDLPRLITDSVALVWGAGKRELVITSTLSLLTAVGVAAQVLIGRAALSGAISARQDGLAQALPTLAALVAITVAMELAQAVQSEQSRVLGELVGRRALDRVLDVGTRVDVIAYESPEFHDRLRRAQAQGQFRSLQTVQGLLGLVGAAVAAVGIIIALATLQPLLVPLVLVGFVPLWIATAANSRDLYKVMWGMTPNDRQRMYLQHVLLDRDSAKEVRAFSLAPFLRRRYDRLYDERIGEMRSLAWRRTGRALVGSLGSAAVVAGSLGVLAWLYASGRMSLAAAGAAIFGLYQLSNRLRAMHFSAAALYEATLFVRDYRSFLELEPPREPAAARPAPVGFDRLTVEDVTFRYPESARPALREVSLEIRVGEVIALVGENGSGKTTLAKLIAGLYRPERGRIAWGGVDVSEFDPETLRGNVAVIFQDFERYLLPIRENIGVGRHEQIENFDAIVAAAERADADGFIRRFPEHYDAMLGREFLGGYDLSIGQWQRLALARAFFRDASLVILDEPTAALDARAESRLFERMRELLDGRAALLISHRFSSVRSADRIYVLDRGRVAEHGTHDELMTLGGQYAELFTLQAAAYLDSAPAAKRPVR